MPLHFAVREGQIEAVRVLLDVGAEPAALDLGGDDLPKVARDRGHEEVARLIEAAAARHDRIAPARPGAADHPVHAAAAADDVEPLPFDAQRVADARLEPSDAGSRERRQGHR